jgi:hypothetical protein
MDAWEQAHDDAAVVLSTAKRDGYVLLSGAIAGTAAGVCELVYHAGVTTALGLGPGAFVSWAATELLGATPGAASLGTLAAAKLTVLLLGTGAGVVFALIADRLHHRNDILFAAIAYGFALFLATLAALQLVHTSYPLPLWELLGANLVYGTALVTQQACMDIFEHRVRARVDRRREEGPVRLPTLGPA